MSRVDPALLVILLLAVALRLPGLFTDFWLDEIWTLNVASRMSSALDVFTDVRHSNNHHLNTLVFYWLGDLQSWSVYRIHSLIAGVASVGLAWKIAARTGRMEAVFASGLCASSYLLIHFSSEARGYSMLLFFALASFWLLQDLDRSTRASRVAGFWLCACLGFLSHLMYLHAFLASAAWMLLRLLQSGAPPGRALLRMLQLFGVPGLFLVGFYLFDIRLTKIGAGPVFDPGEVLVRALSYGFGGPASGPMALAAGAGTAALWTGSIVWLFKRGRPEWLFFAIVIFVSPALVFAVLRPDVFFVRYFLLGTTFGLLAVSGPLAAGWRAGGARRLAVGVALGLILFGNGIDTSRFYRYGRGSYLDAMRFMAESAPERPATVGGDHRFRNRSVIDFYNRYLPPHQQLRYLPQDQLPEWFVQHRIGRLNDPHPVLVDGQGHAYELKRVARYSDLSGWHWLVYRKVPREISRQRP